MSTSLKKAFSPAHFVRHSRRLKGRKKRGGWGVRMQRSGKRREKKEENRVCGNAVCARAIVIAVKSETRPLLTLALPSIAILCTLLEFPEGLSCRGGKEAAAGRRPDAVVPCRAVPCRRGPPLSQFQFPVASSLLFINLVLASLGVLFLPSSTVCRLLSTLLSA